MNNDLISLRRHTGFKFEHMWMQHGEFDKILKET